MGERRWEAARMADPETLSCIVVEELIETNELLTVHLVENALRKDSRQVGHAKAYRRLMNA